MKQPIDLALQFLLMAQRDMRAFDILVEETSVADESIGFHAQQIVEKCLKAVLAFNQIEFRKVHDLDALLELLTKNGLPEPPEADSLDELNPYAVFLRYDLAETQSLDRQKTKSLVQGILAWGKRHIGNK